MDTRFWGPSGWHLLHLIAADTITAKRRAAVKEWINLLEFILPCKYCRASFHDYLELQPLTDDILANPDTFSRWLYDIHNRVNGKLRGQGLITTDDPSWSSVHARYTQQHRDICKGSPLLGWDFMTSIAYATPTKESAKGTSLTLSYRLTALKRWWKLIPAILPCEPWRRAWAMALQRVGEPPLAAGREAVMRWMWRIEESVCAGLKCPTPHSSLPALNEEVAAFESGCAKDRKGKTCRTRKHRQRRQVLSRRRVRE